MNDEITHRQLRLIAEDGGQLGVVSGSEANQKARAEGLDLIEIAPNAAPPVCKIMDYGKFK
jgi:translation initiation factor IF-3